MSPAPNWYQLLYDVARLASMLAVLLGFIYCVGLLARGTLKDCSAFMKAGLKAEVTQLQGWFDVIMFVIFCVFVYSHAVTELILRAVGLTAEASDPKLWNATVRDLLTAACFWTSVVFVGVLSYRKRDQGPRS